MFQQIMVWLLVAWIWGVILYFSSNLTEMFGRIPRADKNLGGTKNAYVLWWFGIMLLWFLIMFGVMPIWSPTEVGWL